ncbi:sensor histidine kinase [Actinomadura macrotermitis]|uniref:Oxygen sensor histidine kinase NreB n=1 Tax=Actinomadura macrotermitis TaxID=2585200 RepID=A0A7K0BVF7_9ACTN|nr:sensor histidine kinase [Actinomadura macrotermitis]MQY04872.1 hypothetical protein [Actinomadura macrotermitis]
MRRDDDPYRIHLWNSLSWLLLGLAPDIVAAQGDQGAMRYWSSALPVALAVAYGLAWRFPRPHGGHPQRRGASQAPGASAPRREWFLCVLVAGLGALAYLRGGAALYVVSLPMFWLFAATPRRSVAFSGAAALATVAGWTIRTGDPFAGNAVVTVAAFAAAVLLGLSVHRRVRRGEERARRLDAELAEARAQLAEAHRREGAAAERDRLAREIHDTLAQGFAAIVALAEAARADPAASGPRLRSIERTARDNLAEARTLVEGAAPAGSIAATLRRTLDRFAEDTGLAVSADLPDVECDRPARIALLRCTQESLANIRKHAGATTVGVVLARYPHGVELEITDDGRGFAPGRAGGFGLAGMRRRLAELGGELTVTSSVGDGTRVLAALPLNGRT